MDPKTCRTCLAKRASKHISELKNEGSNSTGSDIMLFCLDIKVADCKEESTKLCLKCYKKILQFSKFKLDAQKNYIIFKNTELERKIKHEVYTSNGVKDEGSCNEGQISEGFINETAVKAEYFDDNDDCQSDNELLSVIKKIKYEYVVEENFDETKENEPIKNLKHRKKVSKEKLNTKQVCEECGKSVRNLKDHMMLHGPAHLRKRLPCKICDKTFASRTGRRRHTRIKHLGYKGKCNICNKEVVSIKQHTLLMHEQSRLQHECPSCGRRFISQSALDAHATMHTSDRPFACDLCDKTFRMKILLAQHRRRVHLKEKLHLCQYCSKSFFKKYHLQTHLRIHTKERPYECPDCGKFFTSSTVLKNHRYLHTNTKIFTCTFCDMTFARPGYLRTHMNVHTKLKKHPCKYCGVKFGRSDHRKRHEYTAHEKHMIASNCIPLS